MKFDKKKIWGLCGQILFAIFIIIALYALGFDHYKGEPDAMQPVFSNYTKNHSMLTGDPKSIYGLGMAAIVIAFVAIVMPLISMFYENKKMNMAFGWATMFLDVTVLAVALAAAGLYASDATKTFMGVKGKLSNAGYIAGNFIFTIVGAGLGIAGNAIAYKNDLKAN